MNKYSHIKSLCNSAIFKMAMFHLGADVLTKQAAKLDFLLKQVGAAKNHTEAADIISKAMRNEAYSNMTPFLEGLHRSAINGTLKLNKPVVGGKPTPTYVLPAA